MAEEVASGDEDANGSAKKPPGAEKDRKVKPTEGETAVPVVADDDDDEED